MPTDAVGALRAASDLGTMGASMLHVALALVDGGWPVFPCGLDKAPLVSGGFKSRSADPAQVTRWWEMHPEALPGIVPGDQDLAAIDVDSAAAYIAAGAAGLWAQDNFVVRTGGTSTEFDCGGITMHPVHIYVRTTEQPKIKGVVVRFRGGYVIAPGARRGERVYYLQNRPVTESGSNIWPPVSADPAVWNEVTSELPEPAVGVGPISIERVRAAVERIPNTELTDREQYVGMAHMIRNAAGDDGRGIFLDWAARFPGGADPHEDERVWDTLPPSRLGWRDLWMLAARHGFDASPEIAADAQADFTPLEQVIVTVEDTRGKIERMLAAVRDAVDAIDRVRALKALRVAGFTAYEVRMMMNELTPTKSDEGMTLRELHNSPELLKKPEPAIPALCWYGLKTLFASREKMGKSSIAMAGAAAVTRGDIFLGEQTRRQRVLWLTEEAYSIIDERAMAEKADMDLFTIVVMGTNPQAQLRRAMARYRPSIVVIDTLFRFAGIDGDDENDSGTWMPILLQFDEVTRAGAALLLLAHSTKSSQNGEYRGSSAIGGFVDAILEMKRPSSEGDRVRRIAGRGRLNFGKPFAYRLEDDGSFQLMADADAQRQQKLDRDVLEFIQQNPMTTGNQIAIALRMVGRHRDEVTSAVNRLLSAKQTENKGTERLPKWVAMTAETEMTDAE